MRTIEPVCAPAGLCAGSTLQLETYSEPLPPSLPALGWGVHAGFCGDRVGCDSDPVAVSGRTPIPSVGMMLWARAMQSWCRPGDGWKTASLIEP
jgi:hypothetical protein